MKFNQIKTGAVLSYVILALNIVVGLIYTPFMLKHMGQSEYGLYSLASSVVGYLTILDFGFGNAIIRYTAKYRALDKKEEEYRLYGMFFVIYIVIAVMAVIGGIILYENIQGIFSGSLTFAEIKRMKIIMALLIFNLAISFPFGIFGSIITAYEDFIFIKLVSIIRTILYPLIMTPLLLIGYKAIGMVVVITGLNILCFVCNIVYCFCKIGIRMKFGAFDLSLLKEIIVYSFYIFLNIIMDKINWSTDQFILGIVRGTGAVAVYSIAAQLNTYYLSFSTVISGVFLPRLTIMVTKGSSDRDLSDLFIKVGRIQYIMMAFVMSGFILFGQNFINAWAGKSYAGAYPIALFLMIPVTVPLIQNLGISILQAQNRQRFRSIVYFLIAVINILVSIWLGRIFGGAGCAAGTAIALILGQIITMNIYYHKQIHMDIPRFWKEIARMTIPVAAAAVFGVGVCYLLPYEGYFWLFVKIALYSAAYIPCMWFWGMNPYEKALLGKPAVKVMRMLRPNR